MWCGAGPIGVMQPLRIIEPAYYGHVMPFRQALFGRRATCHRPERTRRRISFCWAFLSRRA
ncbi:MAG: hypothetical protein C5B56_04750 [Proteobacteria bacterium]|nr:MAG: hypothetical protein C5B56_04750 [Pseudomonadota bacterium]